MAEPVPAVEPETERAITVAKESKPTPDDEEMKPSADLTPKPIPIISSLRIPTSGSEGSPNHDIREEREELREAAERTLNTIVDLNLDCTVKWASPSWVDVVGTLPDFIKGRPFSELIISDNKTVFKDVVESMRRDDSRSHRVRFAIALGPLSKLLPLEGQQPVDSYDGNGKDYSDGDGNRSTDGRGQDKDDETPNATPVGVVASIIDIEAQGIMVYDNTSGGESHTMWMLRPWIAPREIKIDLPTVIVDTLGSGAEVLASYLTQLAEAGVDEPEKHPVPPPALCRICERHISPWWFEKHTDLCLQEHRAELDVQMAQESLTEHRHAIVKVLDALEARKGRTLTGDQAALPAAEYKGSPIGPPPSTHSSPGTSSARSGDGSTGVGHSRTRSFAVRRPQVRIVELLVDLCDTALEINSPALKDSTGEARSDSPDSDSLISQVMQWQSPSSNTLDQEQGLALLCADTERAAKAKVEAIFRHRQIIEYAERIRLEFADLVQDCIDHAIRKAARIAAGRLSDSTDYDEVDDSASESQSGSIGHNEARNGDDADGPLEGNIEKDLHIDNRATVDRGDGTEPNSLDLPEPGLHEPPKKAEQEVRHEQKTWNEIRDEAKPQLEQEPCEGKKESAKGAAGPGSATTRAPQDVARKARGVESAEDASALVAALKDMRLRSGSRSSLSSPLTSVVEVTLPSGATKECRTSKSLGSTYLGHVGTGPSGVGSGPGTARESRRQSLIVLDSDTGAESDSSMRSSSIVSRMAPRTESPISEYGDLRRAANARQHQNHRRSLILPGAASPRRQESPSRVTQPSSPLRTHKSRNFPLPQDVLASPELVPILPSGSNEFGSLTPATVLPTHYYGHGHSSNNSGSGQYVGGSNRHGGNSGHSNSGSGSHHNPPHNNHHHHVHHSHHRRQSSAAMTEFVMKPPPSPRLGANNGPPAPPSRSAQPSIKDFEIIKPISKGAFGSVYLSKKKSTGEYFAIKVLKKADMVAKNQVHNVKAERAIMMWQGESEFVAKLYWTFSSKDYLYLVMEYLNGGDCASLIKVLGGLPEDWAKKYLAEVVLGVEHLHSRDIIHRDLKPDNLLIDQKGHLKLTDFGLSRMGLVGRQKRALHSGENVDPTPDLLRQGPFTRSASMASSRSTSMDVHGLGPSPNTTPQITPDYGSTLSQPSYFSLAASGVHDRRLSSHRSDSGGSENLARMLHSFSIHDSELPSQPPPPSQFVSPSSSLQPQPQPAIALPSQTHLLTQRTHTVDGITEPSHVYAHQSTGSSEMPLPPVLQHQSSSMAEQSSIDLPHHLQHLRGTPPPGSVMVPPVMALFDPEDTNRRFVGTPDYLAPETIKGEKQNETSDWWSVGCIMYEFLYGTPPFNAEEAELVFDNILARRIQWPDDIIDDDDEEAVEPISDEAKDLINRLLCMDPQQRLGSNKDESFASGGEEIRHHSWFADLNWGTLLQDEAQFVPEPENPEDTEYFDARGAVLQSFAEEVEDQFSPSPTSAAGSQEYPDRPHDALSRVRSQVNSIKRGLMPLHIPPHVRDLKSRRLSEPVTTDDFGNFSYKNLPALERANKDVIQKLRAEAMASQSRSGGGSSSTGGSGNALVSPGPYPHAHPSLSSPLPSLEGSPVMANPVQKTLSSVKSSNRPQSPSAISHANSSPSRVSQPSSPLLVSFVAGPGSEGRRKASGNSSSFTYDIPRVPPSLQKAATSVAASPARGSLGRSGSGASSSGAGSVASGGAGSGNSNGTAAVGHRDRDGSLATITTIAPTSSTTPMMTLASSTRNIGGGGNEAAHANASNNASVTTNRPGSEKGKDIGTGAGDSCHGSGGGNSTLISPHRSTGPSRQSGVAPTGRCRSSTGSSQPQDSSPTIPPEGLAAISVGRHRNRMSQVLSDVSPSSSDNEDKHTRLRVHRRRPGSRRISHANPPPNPDAGPSFRPLDVLICEDHPVSRMVMEKLLEKLRCRTISVPNGSEAVRYSMSEITFDIIFLEYKLPQINGADVARMIRETKNANAHTPIVAITAYLKELQAPHYFDSLIEKPISSSKLSEVLRTLCHWRPASPSRVPSMASLSLSLPARPVTSTASATASFCVAAPLSASASVVSSTAGMRQSSSLWSGGNRSPTCATSSSRVGSSNLVPVTNRVDSASSSLYEDTESVITDDVSIVISRRATGDWEDGLGIKDDDTLTVGSTVAPLTMLVATTTPVPTPATTSTTASTAAAVDQTPSKPTASNPTDQVSVPTNHDQGKMPLVQRYIEGPKDKKDRTEKRPTESGSTDSADDEDEEIGTLAIGDNSNHINDSRSSFRPRTVKGTSKGVFLSSKLGIEMMRADSHDRIA